MKIYGFKLNRLYQKVTMMRDILALIEREKIIYAQSPLFVYMQDQGIHPLKKLAFAPCAAPFIMGFADLCKYVLRQEPTADPIQAILNQHTYEDDNHWKWFLEDLDKLGFNYLLNFNNSLEFLWGQETKCSRFLLNELYCHLTTASPIDKLIILEVMEAAADIFLSYTRDITIQIKQATKQEYKYFGNCHFDAETGHAAHEKEVTALIKNIIIPEQNRTKSVELVQIVFDLFCHWNLGLLSYAQNYPISQPALNQQPAELVLVST